MKEFKKLFQVKRIITFVLAVAMVVTMMPTTAFAAPMTSVSLEQNETEVVASEATVSGDETTSKKTVLTMDLDEEDKNAVYYGGSVFSGFETLKEQVKVTVDDKEVTPLATDLTLAWKMVKDGKLVDLPEGTTEPINAGTYNLSVSLARGENYGAATIEGGVEFVIAPAKVEVEPNWNSSVKAGTKVGDIKVSSANYGPFSFITDNADTKDVDESANSEIAIAVTVRDAFDAEKTALEADTVLVSNGDYVVDFVASFTKKGEEKANGNYVLGEIASKDVRMTNDISTKIAVTYAKEWEEKGREIHRTYTGEEISISASATETISGNDYFAKVQYWDAAKDEYVDLKDAKLEGTWYERVNEKVYADDYGNTSLEGDPNEITEWVKMESAPVDAGTYFYRLSYAGVDGVYAEAETEVDPYYLEGDIVVVIDPKPVVIVPELNKDAVFYEGMTSADVLAQIDYKVYAADDKDLKNEIEVDRNTVWGTSYDANYMTQPYEPVFELQYAAGAENDKGEFVPDKDDKGNYYFYKNYNTLKAGRIYRVIFTGYKAAVENWYDDYEESWKNINYNDREDTTAELNYEVALDDETLAKHVVTPVEVKPATKSVIDISEIIKDLDGKGDKLENAETRVYNGDALYEKKADYKKAVVKVGDKEIAKDTDSSIEYRWYKNNYNSIIYNTFSKYTNKPYSEGENDFNQRWSNYGYTVPRSAGVYKLQITYKGSKNDGYSAATENVYYVIDQQPIRANLKGDYKALTGQSISEFIEKLGDTLTEDVSLEKLSEVTVSGNLISGGKWVPMEKEELYDTWYISYQILETSADGKESNTYDIWSDEELEFRETYKYQLIANLYNNATYPNYTDEKYVIKNSDMGEGKVSQVLTVDTWEESVPVTVDKMGNKSLSVSVNQTALGEKTKVYDGKPFDVATFLGKAISLIGDDGKPVTSVDLEYTLYGSTWDEDEFDWIDGEITEAVHAGTYTLSASYAGDTTYAPVYEEIATITITPAKITVTPVITDTVEAGTGHLDVWNNARFQQKLVFDGVAEADKDAFTYDINEDGFKAYKRENWYDYGYDYGLVKFTTIDEEDNWVSYPLKGEKSYTLKDAGTNELSRPYDTDYDVEYKEISYTTVRGTSTVYADGSYLRYEYFTSDVQEDWAEVAINDTIEGLKHTIVPVNAIPYSYYYEYGKKIYGNFLAVSIQIPEEYEYDMPSTAMYKNAIEAQGGIIKEDRYSYIDILLDANLAQEVEGKKVTSFDIRWEDGYVETFTFDFTGADLMVNLADAVAPKSIAFNSPASKMAVGETQELDLKLTKVQFNDVVCISYSVDKEDILSVDTYGEVTALKKGSATVIATPVKLENGKKVAIEGAKVAKVKITVTDVATPKIKKVYTFDNEAYVYLDKIADGYRREMYVLEGKNVKASVFEEKIAKMKQLQWEDIFVSKPLFITDKDACTHGFEELSSNKDYTVYVRNVSGVRKADNGHNVELSVAGVTKSFKTNKAQVKALSMTLKDIERVDYSHYKVDLSKGKVSAEVLGGFLAKEADLAMDNEYTYEKLPLNATLKKTYEDPKLAYGVYEYDEYDDYYYRTNIASVDKKGNIKLAGVGTVYVKVWNTAESNIIDEVRLDITGTPTKVTGNSKKLKIGEGIYLEELLTYYAGKKKLVGNFERKVVIDDALVEEFAKNEAFELDEDGWVTAVKEGGKLQVELTDYYIAKNTEGTPTAKVTLTTTPLEPVKNLKIADAKVLGLKEVSLADDYAKVMFTYDGYATGFKIEITDQRGRLIRSSYVQDYEFGGEWIKKGKNWIYYYTYRIDNLTQQSKYNVTITPRYFDAAAKVAKVSFTTTKIPASTARVHDNYHGDRIVVSGTQSSIKGYSFTSGNAYSLKFVGDTTAEAMGTDTLTWSSSNKKVATVKGIAGSYYANFKALRAGTTTIEVKSKITKEVVARWEVTVQTFGDGYHVDRRYYDENIKRIVLNSDGGLIDGTLIDEHVNLDSGEVREFEFIVPQDGTYVFYSENLVDGDPKAYLYSSSYEELHYGDDNDDRNFYFEHELYAGERYYLEVREYNGEDLEVDVVVKKL